MMKDATRLRLATYFRSAAASLGLFKPELLHFWPWLPSSLPPLLPSVHCPARLAERAGGLPKKSNQRLPLQSDMTAAYINFESGQQHDSLQYDTAH